MRDFRKSFALGAHAVRCCDFSHYFEQEILTKTDESIERLTTNFMKQIAKAPDAGYAIETPWILFQSAIRRSTKEVLKFNKY